MYIRYAMTPKSNRLEILSSYSSYYTRFFWNSLKTKWDLVSSFKWKHLQNVLNTCCSPACACPCPQIRRTAFSKTTNWRTRTLEPHSRHRTESLGASFSLTTGWDIKELHPLLLFLDQKPELHVEKSRSIFQRVLLPLNKASWLPPPPHFVHT